MRRANLYTPAYRGGASWFVLELAAAMARAGGDVLLIAPEAEPEAREAIVAATRRIRLPRGGYGAGGKLARAFRSALRIAAAFVALVRARRHSRTYFISFYDWLAVLVAQMLLIRLLGGRLIYVVHDVMPHALPSGSARRWIEMALLRWSYRIPQHLVALTEVARQQLQADFVHAGRISVIPHGAYGKARATTPGHRKRILAFGMLRRNKRIRETIEGVRSAVAAGANLELTIAGEPHQEDLDYWRNCEALLDRTESFIVAEIGFVPEARLDELITRSDAVILPYEDFNSQSGVAILGACSERLLICTDAGGLAELIGHGLEPVLIARPVTADSVADAVARFAAMAPDEVVALARRSRTALQAYLAWDRIGEEYLSLAR